MSRELIDVRSPLAASKNVRVELGQDGTLHLLVGPVTLHLERAMGEELVATLTRGLERLTVIEIERAQAWAARGPKLELVR